MGKIDINTTQKVNIETQKANTFRLVLDVKNEDNTLYDFSNELFILTIFDDNKVPIKILSNHTDNAAASYEINEEPFFLNDRLDDTPSAGSLRFARALSNLLNCDINIFTFDDNFREFPYALLIPNLTNTFRVYVTITESIVNIDMSAFVMHIPIGQYDYNIKIVSDLTKKYDFNNDEIDAYFKNSETWMSGKFIVV